MEEAQNRTKLSWPILQTPDQWIRLLRIDAFEGRTAAPSSDDWKMFDEGATIPLSCTLEAFEITALPEYIALSYTCGKPVPDGLPEPYDSSKALPVAQALHSPDLNWKDAKWLISVNGNSMSIARNLRDALLRLMTSHFRGWIWIDALCINQADLDERAAQVQIMSTIFSHAVRVMVWLGEEDETAAETQLLLLQLHPVISNQRHNLSDWAELQTLHPGGEEYWKHLNTKPTPLQWWWSWCHFLRRTWFYRVWTIQEYALAKNLDVVCGSLCLDRDSFVSIASHVQNSAGYQHLSMRFEPHTALDQIIRPEIMRLESLRELCLKGVLASTADLAMVIHVCGINSTHAWLLTMMLYSKSRFVTNPLDRIYGLLGMLKHLHDVLNARMSNSRDFPWPQVDYAKDPSEVSILVAHQMITALPFLAYLSFVRYRPIERAYTELLPSWVRDLRDVDNNHPSPFGLSIIEGRASYDASRCEKMEASFLHSCRDFSDAPLLWLKMLPVGTICKVLYEIPDSSKDDLDDMLSAILQYLAEHPPEQAMVLHPMSLPDAMWRTLIANKASRCPAEVEMTTAFRAWILCLMLDTATRVQHAPDSSSQQSRDEILCRNMQYLINIHQTYPADVVACLSTIKDVIDAYQGWGTASRQSDILQLYQKFARQIAIRGRKLVVCSSGALALVRRETEEEDAVMLLAGARVPFVVRAHIVVLNPRDAPRMRKF